MQTFETSSTSIRWTFFVGFKEFHKVLSVEIPKKTMARSPASRMPLPMLQAVSESEPAPWSVDTQRLLASLDEERSSFSWNAVRAELDGLPGGRGINIAYEALGRHVKHGHGDQTAIRWLGKKGGRRTLTYSELDALSARFANVLAALGVEPGDRVYSLAGRIPELYVAALGTLKHRAVFCPLFSAFGPEPIAERLNLGEARVLFTTERLYKRRIEDVRHRLPSCSSTSSSLRSR